MVCLHSLLTYIHALSICMLLVNFSSWCLEQSGVGMKVWQNNQNLHQWQITVHELLWVKPHTPPHEDKEMDEHLTNVFQSSRNRSAAPFETSYSKNLPFSLVDHSFSEEDSPKEILPFKRRQILSIPVKFWMQFLRCVRNIVTGCTKRESNVFDVKVAQNLSQKSISRILNATLTEMNRIWPSKKKANFHFKTILPSCIPALDCS